MARYTTTIASNLPPEQAFAYMADFSHAREWDPSVSEASRADDLRGEGATFDLLVRFGGRTIPMQYRTVSFDEPRMVVLESRKPRFTSRDTISIAPAAGGATVTYDALLELNGAARVFDPILQLLFNRTGDNAAAGLRAALNP